MQKPSPGRAATALVLVLALVAAACNGGRDEGQTPTTGPSGTAGEQEGAFTIDTANCESYKPTQGITEDSITFGSSFPQSGLYAAFAKISVGYEAYFRYLNATEGGVGGKQIKVITRNDEYLPDRTLTNTQELVQNEGVFAMFNVVGTPNNLAIRDELADQCVPNLFVATGSPLWGEVDAYPWLIGSIPSYATESAIFADYLKKNKPNAKVAVLYQNDDFGESYLTAFRAAIEGTDIEVVQTASYNPTDPEPRDQITTLAASGADTALLAATALKCPQSLNLIRESNWNPTIYISATCTSNTVVGLAQPGANDGVLSSIYLKDPSDPQWADDPAMQQFQQYGAQYGISQEDLRNGIVGYGWTMGALLAETLRRSPELTRQAVMQTAYSLQDVQVGLLLPGITINTNGAQDPFPIEQMQIGQYNGQYWDLQGELTSFEGTSGQFVK
ncbi:ABC transporter substrate-binding protein [Rhabdothermincola sediminis]|uniref:ABC transporter substrate-binding protein n=1 Tax=Rhabdothermincola sediminis TaxID=2751370 RepID=UPI001AA04830|nr:ABC transporter substrate-binding protein [Rhabdothermincola sediminis]